MIPLGLRDVLLPATNLVNFCVCSSLVTICFSSSPQLVRRDGRPPMTGRGAGAEKPGFVTGELEGTGYDSEGEKDARPGGRGIDETPLYSRWAGAIRTGGALTGRPGKRRRQH